MIPTPYLYLERLLKTLYPNFSGILPINPFSSQFLQLVLQEVIHLQ